MRNNVLVAVSGKHGGGKSTIAKAIAEHFDLEYVSAGSIFRRMAKERDMDVVEFTKFVENHPEIDKQIDNQMKQEAKAGNRVLDSQLAYHFAKPYNPINLLVIAKEKDIVKRVSERENISLEEARREIEIRERNEKNRFKELYGIDLWKPIDFNLVLNTSKISKEKSKKLAIKAVSILQG